MTILLVFLIGMLPSLSHGCGEDWKIQSPEGAISTTPERSVQCFGTFNYIASHSNHVVRYNLNKITPEDDSTLYEGLNIKLVAPASNTETLCYDYAFQIFLNDPSIRCVRHSKDCLGIEDIITAALPVYCKRQTIPQEGDLAVYYATTTTNALESDDGDIPKHFGIYQGDGSITSKWGTESVYNHSPFCVPMIYGNEIHYWRLKPDYTDEDQKSFKHYISAMVQV